MDDQNPDQAIVDESVPAEPTDVKVDPPEGQEPEKPAVEEPTPDEQALALKSMTELNARNQTLYQSLVETTKKYDPGIYEEHREQVSDKPPETPAEPEETEYDDPGEYGTKRDLRALEERLFERLSGADKQKRQAEKQELAHEEYADIGVTLDNYLNDNRIPDAVFAKAVKLIEPMGINVGTKEKPVLGGSSKWLYALTTVLGPYIQAQANSVRDRAHLTQIQVQAADAGRASVMGQQPEGGRGPISTPSAGKKIADDIAPASTYVFYKP